MIKNNSDTLLLELTIANLKRTKTMINIVFFILIWTLFINTAGRIYIYPVVIPFYKGYLVLYSIMLALNIMAWYVITYRRLHVTSANITKIRLTYMTYIILMLCCVTAISVTDAIRLGHVAIFEVYLLVILVLYNLPLRYTLFMTSILTPIIITSIISSPIIEQDHALIISGNVLLIAIMGLICSKVMYTMRVHSIQQQLILCEKNKQNELLMKQLHEKNTEMNELTHRDALTGLYNRRAFNKYMERLQEKNSKEAVIFVMIDIDYFKRYNDHYGHVMGDHVLVQVAQLLQQFANKRGDFVSRWGGEEFMYIALEAEEQQLSLAIQLMIEEASIAHENSPTAPFVTLSIGVYKTIIEPTVPMNYYYELVDRALYSSKSNGRNQITSYEDV